MSAALETVLREIAITHHADAVRALPARKQPSREAQIDAETAEILADRDQLVSAIANHSDAGHLAAEIALGVIEGRDVSALVAQLEGAKRMAAKDAATAWVDAVRKAI